MREKTPATHKVLNILSLEVSGTRLGALVRAPQFVRDVDWVSKTPEDQRPKVRKYCLMSAKGAFTDWHVDMGGSSVWYHVVEGAKVFWFAPPSPKNLDAYAKWISSSSQSKPSFGDLLGESEVVTLMLLAQRRRAWAACNRVILPLRVAERWRTPHALLSGALEDKDDGKTQ